MAACTHKRVVKRGSLVVCADCGMDTDHWYAGSVAGGASPTDPAAAPAAAAATTAALVPAAAPEWFGFPLRALLVLGVGLAVAMLIVGTGGMPNDIIHTLTSLAHEIGHALVAWLLGRPSVPAFDFKYGGGVAMIGERNQLLLWAYAAALAALVWRQRRNLRAAAALMAFGLVIAALALSDAGMVVILSSGHDGEVALAAVFLYRALSGVAVVGPAERWLYAIIGWTVLLHSIALCWNLAFVATARDHYYAGKGGRDNDFVIISHTCRWSLEGVALFHLALSLTAPLLVGAVWRWRMRVAAVLQALFIPPPAVDEQGDGG